MEAKDDNVVVALGSALEETRGWYVVGCLPDGILPEDGWYIPLHWC